MQIRIRVKYQQILNKDLNTFVYHYAMENTANENDSCSNETLYTNNTINLLANGFVQLYKPSLVKTKQQLKELTEKQSIVIEQLHNENLKLAATQYSIELQELFNLVKLYNNKLLNIKKDMKSLHERSIKLKKRSLRLQQLKEKEMYIINKIQKPLTDVQNKPHASKNETM